MNRIRCLLKSVSIASLCWETAVSAWAQGSLTPPGAPAPTFRTLDQIETRTPITNLPFTISQPGSYYLTQSLIFPGETTEGITVQASDVVIDLMGFTLEGSSPAVGIEAESSYTHLTVQNGHLTGWRIAIMAIGNNYVFQNLRISGCGKGIETAAQAVVADCQVVNNDNQLDSFSGIYVGNYSSVRHCIVGNNRGAAGWTARAITVGAYSLVNDCLAYDNVVEESPGLYGISAGSNSRISDCIVRNGHREGITAQSRCSIQDCTSSDNVTGIKTYFSSLIERCTTTQCASNGIWVGTRCQVIGCEVSQNLYQGLSVSGDGNRIENNNCSSNASSGIFVFDDDNRIEGNHVFANDYGIYLRYWGEADKADRNLVLRNSAHQNRSENYHVGSGNFVAPIDSTGAFTSDSANYSF